MEERTAKMLALACSVAGLAILYFSSALMEQASLPADIKTLSLDDVGSSAKVCGSVTGLKNTKGNLLFSIADNRTDSIHTDSIHAVIFNSTASRLNVSGISNGNNICLLGQIQEYPPGSGVIEIVASKVVY